MLWERLSLKPDLLRSLKIAAACIGLCAVSLSSIIRIVQAQTQPQGGRWSNPYRLSSQDGKASEGYLVADQYGYVHAFWTESLFENQRVTIRYARFDGETWSAPNDIYMGGIAITNVSPVVDQFGTLHIAWAEGLSGPAYYTYAPANNAKSVRSWAQPVRINIPARTLHLRIDSTGVYHILYISQTIEPGVFYIRSEDQGMTWSEPTWLDPDILPNHIPDSLSFELDEAGGLHAVWFYGALDQRSQPDWVRYTHSLDGGITWSAPLMIDQVIEENNHNLTTASPIMTVQGLTVHVVWAAGELPYRYHRFSTDAGQTWSLPKQIFGGLHGQAFDGLTVDGAGRVHFFGQIRYPMGIYHAYWDRNQWTPISLIYLVALEGSVEGIGDRIHAHHTHPVVRAGNQLVLTFADGPADPERRLFAMYNTLEDIPPLETVPTPAPTATTVPVSNLTRKVLTPIPTLTVATTLLDTGAQPVVRVPRPDLPIRVALVPTLLLLGGTIAIRTFYKLRNRKHLKH